MKIVGESEAVIDNKNPQFLKTFIIEYIFELLQPVRVQLHQWNDKSQKKEKLLGNIDFNVSKLMGTKKPNLVAGY